MKQAQIRNNTHHRARKVNPSELSIKNISVDIPDVGPQDSLVPVKTPRHTFFRIHPDIEVTACIVRFEDRWYLLSSDIVEAFPKQIKGLSYARLYQGITDAGETFVLPVTEPWRGYPSSWRDSLLDIVDIAADNWVKVASNNERQIYEIEEQKHSRIPPAWLVDEFEDILRLAFAGEFYIHSLDHPILNALLIE